MVAEEAGSVVEEAAGTTVRLPPSPIRLTAAWASQRGKACPMRAQEAQEQPRGQGFPDPRPEGKGADPVVRSGGQGAQGQGPVRLVAALASSSSNNTRAGRSRASGAPGQGGIRVAVPVGIPVGIPAGLGLLEGLPAGLDLLVGSLVPAGLQACRAPTPITAQVVEACQTQVAVLGWEGMQVPETPRLQRLAGCMLMESPPRRWRCLPLRGTAHLTEPLGLRVLRQPSNRRRPNPNKLLRALRQRLVHPWLGRRRAEGPGHPQPPSLQSWRLR